MGHDEFRVAARQSGLPFTDEQIDILFEGYGKLERMLESLQAPPDPVTPPAVVFVPETRP